ncbi:MULTISPECIES: class I SAM-dependent methyltransferase [Spirulina sp. CCY15215]|uniref:class I SAM-dependent methyltransferase n=1 Tax=Spirulina sp. CCY15215 TaxID=2767591 RepID=UPI00195253FD
MPTINWLKKEFYYGYSSGNILSLIPDRRRRNDEQKSGGSYRRVFYRAILPHITTKSVVLELGPGSGSWSRAILKYIPNGKLLTVDFQNVTEWLQPQNYQGRLECYQVNDRTFSCIEDNSIDFFWSFGVLCHNNIEHIQEILAHALPKIKPQGFACHQYGDWNKLEIFGWKKGGVPLNFKETSDDEIWWPRNSKSTMKQIAEDIGWSVIDGDLGLLKRDGIILLQRPQ